MQKKSTLVLRVASALALLAFLFGLAEPVLAQSGLTLLFHGVQASPVENSPSYNVSLYFSLLDSAGNPIKDASAADFTLMEDSQQVTITSVALAQDEPISVAILIDTSYSMSQDEKIDAARQAAIKFIDKLQGNDRVSVIAFDTTVTPRIDFTTDHTAARQQVDLIEVNPNGGTCLYNAAHDAVQAAANQPAGRRAIILLTDGVDDKGGKPCSSYTVEEVINQASDVNGRVPIYTIGLGLEPDVKSLQRLADMTGGRYQESPGPTQLDALFSRIADELRSQYVLHYTSVAAAGQHDLTLKVNYQNNRDEFSTRVDLPAMPYGIAFTVPENAATVSGSTAIAVAIFGTGAPIQKVIFLANGASIGSDTSVPYEIAWDPAGLPAGEVTLEAAALDAAGNKLASSSVTVAYQPAGPTPTATPEPGGSGGSTKISTLTIILIAVVGLIVVVVVVIVVVISGKRRRVEKERDRQWQETVQGTGVETPVVSMEDRTMDSFTPSEGALGVLVIIQSDDPAMVHQRIEITKSTTTLGRKADNDVIFAKDSPVSRHHAVIEERSGQMFLSELMATDDSGQAKRPAYGTFLNGAQIQETVLLHNGDEILLGKRVRIRFESVRGTSGDDDRTMDQSTPSGEDKTMDFDNR